MPRLPIRLASVRSAARLAAVVMAAAVLAAGCGGNKGRDGDGGGPQDEEIVVDGRVSVRGSTPFTLLLLEGRDGTMYMLESSRMAEELKQLDGMDITVTARVLPNIEGESPALSVKTYDLLPLPTGERPIVGVILSPSPGQVFLRATDGMTWSVKGDFQSVLSGYNGAKVWVVGERNRGVPATSRDIREIFVTQYGVIRR